MVSLLNKKGFVTALGFVTISGGFVTVFLGFVTARLGFRYVCQWGNVGENAETKRSETGKKTVGKWLRFGSFGGLFALVQFVQCVKAQLFRLPHFDFHALLNGSYR